MGTFFVAVPNSVDIIAWYGRQSDCEEYLIPERAAFEETTASIDPGRKVSLDCKRIPGGPESWARDPVSIELDRNLEDVSKAPASRERELVPEAPAATQEEVFSAKNTTMLLCPRVVLKREGKGGWCF